MARKIILFELNEVPQRIVEEYCRRQPESRFARQIGSCSRYETVTEDVGNLSPWTTWPSLHRGVSNETHLLSDFGQDTRALDASHPPLWNYLVHHGVSVGVCGSLHTYPMPADLSGYAFYLPDTFAAGAECFPAVLETFQEFNLTMARESARNVSTRVPWAAALRLLANAPGLGIKPATLFDVGQQLMSERRAPERRVRRRTYQSVLAFDVFMQQMARTRPAFATFFTNHVASSMHRYWAAAFPGDYDAMEFTPEWIATYRDEIQFAMHKAEAMLARVLDFADRNPEYTVWITTSMGQAATIARPVETQLYVTDPDRLMAGLGFAPGEWERRPAMLPQFNVVVAPERQAALTGRLAQLRIASMPFYFRARPAGFVSLDFGHDNLDPAEHAELDGQAISFESLGLTNTEIDDKSGTCAYHIPQGCLFIYDPRDLAAKTRAATPVSTLDIAPAILQNFGIGPPSYMHRAAHLAGPG